MAQTIAVLLTCFNRRVKTISCLTSLFEAELPKNLLFEVFLVDDDSTDGTFEAVELYFPQVNLIKGTGELYWNRGMHLAWQTAVTKKSFDYFLWINDDIKIFKNGLIHIFKDHLQYPKSIITGVMVSEEDGIITYGGEDKHGNLIKPDRNVPKLCYFLNGNLVLIPNYAFQKLGMLDPIFPHAIGDFDYGLRAIKKGVECRISTKSLGYCETNPQLPLWCRQNVSFRNRIKSLYSPLGYSHPYYFFIYENRHFGILTALKHFVSIHLRVIAPTLWK